MRRLAILGLQLCALAACNPDTDQPTGVPMNPARDGAVTSVEELLLAARKQSCFAMFQCGLSALSPFEDEAECFESPLWERLQTPVAARRSALIALEAEGRVRVDPARVEQCFDRVGECGTLALTRYVECTGMIEGMRASGESCNLNEECKGDAYCHFDGRSCPGVCMPRLPTGAECGLANDVCSGGGTVTTCKLDLVDNRVRDTGSCAPRALRYAAGKGAACGASVANQAVELVLCPVELFCDYAGDPPPTATTAMGTCQPLLATGTACDSRYDRCERGAVCTGAAGEQACRTFTWLSAGQACVPLDETEGAACDLRKGLACNAGRCRPLGDGRAGAPCESGVPCAEGFHCDGMQCVALAPAAAACQVGSDCESGACGPDRTCRAQYCDADPF